MKRGTPDHPKVSHLVNVLGASQPLAVGLLESLWHFAARYTADGNIGKYSNSACAAGIKYDGDADALFEALHESGWIDPLPDGGKYLHDWHDHCEDAVHMYLFRHGLRFANGREPSAKRISKKEREAMKVKSVVRTEGAQGAHEVAAKEPLDICCAHEVGTVCALPLPLPEPMPEPRDLPDLKNRDMDFFQLESRGTSDQEDLAAEFVALWNSMAETCGLSKSRKLGDERRACLIRKAKKNGWLDRAREAIKVIPDSPQLVGGNESGWKASIAWLIDRKNAVDDILSGRYRYGKKRRDFSEQRTAKFPDF